MSTVSTGGLSSGVASGATNGNITWNNNGWNWSETGSNSFISFDKRRQYGTSSVTEHEAGDGSSSSPSGSWTGSTNGLLADTVYKARAKGTFTWYSFDIGANKSATRTGNTFNIKTGAVAASASTPTSSNITKDSADIACNYYPNVSASTCTAQLQYKRQVDSTWTNAGTPNTNGGYAQGSVSASLSSLESSTVYNVRLHITRTTGTGQTLDSATASFTTLAGTPEPTTLAATNVNATTALLNGSLVINAGTNVNCYFKYDTVTPPVANTTANIPMSADGGFQQAISGLSASTPYYFQAFASFDTPTGSPTSGSILSFTTPANPLADAILEDHVLLYEYDRKYGVITDGSDPTQDAIIFSVADVAASTSDRFLNAAAPWAAGDVKISIDGGAVANVTNLPTRIGSTPLYTLTLTAAEMQGNDIYVYLVDANGPAWRDTLLHIRTHQALGTVDIDAATGQKANTTALRLRGYGSGHGLSATGGATGRDIDGVLGDHVLAFGTIDAGSGGTSAVLASGGGTTTDMYVGGLIMITSGTGIGQCRTITAYTQASKTVTVNRTWASTPAASDTYIIIAGPDVWNLGAAAELASVPASTGNYGLLLQLCFQRFAFKITQTATVQTLYKANDSSTLSTRSVSDNGTTQTVGKLS